MRDMGTLEPISRGLFRLAALPPLGHPDLVPVAKRVPDGVPCLLSALSLHEPTTQIPHEVHVALPRGADRPRLEHTPLRLFWSTGRAYSEGVETRTLDGVEVRACGAAKSVADAFEYRHKIGLDVAVEALRRPAQGRQDRRPAALRSDRHRPPGRDVERRRRRRLSPSGPPQGGRHRVWPARALAGEGRAATDPL
jgi:predicted transcriptional regulator of viral defense system